MTVIKKISENYEALVETDLLKTSEILKLCYVVDYGWGSTKYKDGFYTLIIKTSDGITLPARIFNLKYFMSAGIEIASLKGKFILLRGTPQIFRDRYSIIVEEILQIDQSIVESKEDFIGKISDADLLFSDCENVFKTVEKTLPYSYKVVSYPSIYSGRLGGFTKFMWDWVFQAFVYGKNIGDALIIPLYYSVILYEKSLSILNLRGMVTKGDILNLLKELPDSKKEYSEIAMDSLSAILGLGRPEHLYANIIYTTFNTAMTVNNMFTDWSSLVKGGELKLKDYTLRKY